jgi:putative acetyltransferase
VNCGRDSVDRYTHPALSETVIRIERPEDHAATRDLIIAAMDVSDATLVDRLRAEGVVIASLVAVESTRIVAHVLFSRLTIHTADGAMNAVALAPMAVAPTVNAAVSDPH